MNKKNMSASYAKRNTGKKLSDVGRTKKVAGGRAKSAAKRKSVESPLGSTAETRPSDSVAVDAYMKTLKHPLAELAAALRKAILGADPTIGEEIKWNAPAFFYTGAMEPFDPKEYRRHLVVFNFYRKDCIRLVFWRGDRANDKSGLLEGDYADGRRLAHFSSLDDLSAGKKALVSALKSQLRHIKS